MFFRSRKRLYGYYSLGQCLLQVTDYDRASYMDDTYEHFSVNFHDGSFTSIKTFLAYNLENIFATFVAPTQLLICQDQFVIQLSFA